MKKPFLTEGEGWTGEYWSEQEVVPAGKIWAQYKHHRKVAIIFYFKLSLNVLYQALEQYQIKFVQKSWSVRIVVFAVINYIPE